jgi:hypothetical protein
MPDSDLQSPPWQEDRYAMKWDGEWHITYEVFRDLGCLCRVLALSILVVAWFRTLLFRFIMALSPDLVGFFAHWALAFSRPPP